MKESEKELLRPLEADGIQEYDNQLPRWWVWLFYFTIAAGLAYGIHLHVFGGETLIEAYNQEVAAFETSQEVATSSAESGSDSVDELRTRLKSEEYITAGKDIFDSTCMPCHAIDGGGGIGPNLTDKYWIHGNSPEAIVNIIAVGVPAKGMVAWKPMLGQKKVEEAAAYVMSLLGTTPANPKEPEGELHE